MYKTNNNEFVKICGGGLPGIGCGKFLTKQNWMKKDGSDGRKGDKGNVPLCPNCGEDYCGSDF